MGTRSTSGFAGSAKPEIMPNVRRRAGDTYQFAGSENALYERHLTFDNIVDLSAIESRECFEVFARAVRDVHSRQWLKAKDAYAGQGLLHKVFGICCRISTRSPHTRAVCSCHDGR